MKDLVILFSNNIFIEILMLVICADMLLGVLRAIKFRQFNSSVGIDGAIRKVAMVVSVGILMLADLLIHVNLRNMFITLAFRNWECVSFSVCCLQPVNACQY